MWPDILRKTASERIFSEERLKMRADNVLEIRKYALVLAVAAGSGLGTAARADLVYSWGSNASGRLGQGSTAASPVLAPAQVASLASVNVTQVAGGGSFGMALSDTGSVYVWGSNNSRQLADGVTSGNDFSAHPNPALVGTFPSGTTIAKAAGEQNAGLAITSTGGVVGWGANNVGNLGLGTTVATVSTPAATLNVGSDVTGIAGGFTTGFAIKGGALFGWGANTSGQVGDGTSASPKSTPVAVANMSSGVTSVAAGVSFTTAIKDGVVYSWGLGSLGGLGNGGTATSLVPVKVSGITGTATQVAAGLGHGLALVGNTVYSWGYNSNGQVGNGTTTNALTAAPVSGLEGTIVAIEANDFASYALTSDGSIWVWGANNVGQLGLGNTTQFTTPQLLSVPGVKFTSISTGLSVSSGSSTNFVLATAVVPEPSGGLLAISALGLLGSRRRR